MPTVIGYLAIGAILLAGLLASLSIRGLHRDHDERMHDLGIDVRRARYERFRDSLHRGVPRSGA